jgi:hypothetical protein
MKYSRIITTKLVLYGLVLVLTCVFGFVGFLQLYRLNEIDRDFISIAYDVVRLFVLEHSFYEHEVPLLLNIARFLAPALLATAIINAFYHLLKENIDEIVIKYFYANHTIFCGLGIKTKLAIEANEQSKDFSKVVVIERDAKNPFITDVANLRHVKVIIGDAADRINLKKAGLLRSSKVFISTGGDISNMNIAQIIHNIMDGYQVSSGRNERKLKIILDLVDPMNERMFKQLQHIMYEGRKQAQEPDLEMAKAGKRTKRKKARKQPLRIQFSAFNVYRAFAAFLIDEFSPDKFHSYAKEKDPPAKILVHGFDMMGENLVLEAAFIYHFAHFKKTHITIVDSNIAQKREKFLKVHPQISAIVELSFVEESPFWADLDQYADGIVLAFICSDNDAENYMHAFRLRQWYFTKNLEASTNPDQEPVKSLMHPHIVLASSNFDDVFEMLDKVQTDDPNRQAASFSDLNIKIYRMFSEVCAKHKLLFGNPEVDKIARAIHTRYSGANKTPWDDLTDEGKDMNRWGARHLMLKLRYLGAELTTPGDKRELFNFAEVEEDKKVLLAKWEHERWNAEKLLTGFVPGKEISDTSLANNILKPLLRWHKSIIPWGKLNQETQDIDHELTNIKELVENMHNIKIVKRSS